MVEHGKFNEVLKDLKGIAISDPELEIQRIRAKVFVGEYASALELLRILVSHPGLELTTKGVCLQMIGHCLLELGDFHSAIDSLEASIQIANSLGNRLGKLSSHLFMVKANCYLDNLDLAETHLNEALANMAKADENFRWVIGVYRTWGFLLYCQNDPRFLEKMMSVLILTQSLGDWVYFFRTAVEISVMAKGAGLQLPPDMYNSAAKFVKKHELLDQGDLSIWLDVVGPQQRRQEWPLSLKFLTRINRSGMDLSAAQQKRIPDLMRVFEAQIWSHQWILDCNLATLWDIGGKTGRSFQEESPLLKLIEGLNNSTEPIALDKSFEMAWGIRWNESIHANTISVAINRLNVKKPSYSIIRKASSLYLRSSGWIC